MSDCGCHVIKIDNKEVGRDWQENCPVHGVTSDWYLNQGGKAYFDAYLAYTIEMQRLAREARRTGIPGIPPAPPNRSDYIKKER